MSEQLGFKTKLQKIQFELKAPKNLYNKFGNYYYRNVESILEAVKPLCDKYKCVLTLEDEPVVVGERYYIKTTATLIDCESDAEISKSAYAKEDADKKGMDGSQLTGATISYARKYCLNGLFLLDDTKDADTDEYLEETEAKAKKDQKAAEKTASKAKPTQAETDKSKISEVELHGLLQAAGDKGVTVEQLKAIHNVLRLEDLTKAQFDKLMRMLDKTPKAGTQPEKSNNG